MTNSPTSQDSSGRGSSAGWLFDGIRFVIRMALFVALLFGPAGKLRWWPGWAFVAVTVTGGLALYVMVERRQPGLMARRRRMGTGTKTWDKVWMALFFMVFLAVMVIGALDSGRFGWAPLPLWASAFGAALMWLCYWGFGWAMCENRHFESTVRIQEDLQHTVIDTGPYAYVRHPGYVAGLLIGPATALLLCSWWALVVAALTGVGLVWRTAREDATLHEELEGYVDYAQRVRFRLLPGLW